MVVGRPWTLSIQKIVRSMILVLTIWVVTWRRKEFLSGSISVLFHDEDTSITTFDAQSPLSRIYDPIHRTVETLLLRCSITTVNYQWSIQYNTLIVRSKHSCHSHHTIKTLSLQLTPNYHCQLLMISTRFSLHEQNTAIYHHATTEMPLPVLCQRLLSS